MPVAVFLTVSKIETDAVLDAFLDQGVKPGIVNEGGIVYFYLGFHNGVKIIHAKSGMGKSVAHTRAQQAIEDWNPKGLYCCRNCLWNRRHQAKLP